MPDIQFELLGLKWLLLVKVGDSLGVIKSAFLQYLRHKEESGIERGLLLFLPDSFRKVPAWEDTIRAALGKEFVTVLVDAIDVKEEIRSRPFPQVLDILHAEVAPRIRKGITSYYSLDLVIGLLREQLTEIMGKLALRERQILKVVTSWELLSGLARLAPRDAKEASKFLAAYIVLSQVLFLRLYSAFHPEIGARIRPANRTRLRRAFRRVLEVNYRPIFELDVLNVVPETFLRDTFDLIWGMEVEKVRYELPGRIFHELMPSDIRKMLAAFYTRPQAAELLARLAIQSPNARVFDPASGSGTILTAAYRAKHALHEGSASSENPHRRFCEHEIYGGDIMPFAQHLTCANLAAMDVRETIERTQILLGDSLDIVPGEAHKYGLHQYGLFVRPAAARKRSGELYGLVLREGSMDAVLMNPPFTKVERGIRGFVNMERFRPSAGGEVGLWGHFIFLADMFLRKNGTYAAVLPINVLRGRESAPVRRFAFSKWTPTHVIKCTRNYGFSEWAEYRDILFIARKKDAAPGDRLKFALLKKDLTKLTTEDIEEVVRALQQERRVRGELIDVDTYKVEETNQRFPNMMWFCATSDFSHRDVLVGLTEKASTCLGKYPTSYFREGYRPVPIGVSKFLFLTRETAPPRVEQAFLRFTEEDTTSVTAYTALGSSYRLEKKHFVRSLRTPVGLQTMDITGAHDYIAIRRHSDFGRVKRAAGYRPAVPESFWEHVRSELDATETIVVVNRRINPYSPNTHLNAFFTDEPLSPSNQLNVVVELDARLAKAFCVILNSWIFWTQFFLLKEESTGRFIDIRFYDLAEMFLKPQARYVTALNDVYAKFARRTFPSLREQFDRSFDERYEEFWESQSETQQARLCPVLDKRIDPSPIRVEFDLAVSKALGIDTGKEELADLYRCIIEEMMITRSLSPD